MFLQLHYRLEQVYVSCAMGFRSELRMVGCALETYLKHIWYIPFCK